MQIYVMLTAHKSEVNSVDWLKKRFFHEKTAKFIISYDKV